MLSTLGSALLDPLLEKRADSGIESGGNGVGIIEQMNLSGVQCHKTAQSDILIGQSIGAGLLLLSLFHYDLSPLPIQHQHPAVSLKLEEDGKPHFPLLSQQLLQIADVYLGFILAHHMIHRVAQALADVLQIILHAKPYKSVDVQHLSHLQAFQYPGLKFLLILLWIPLGKL